MNLHVVVTVTGEPVELVYDAEGHPSCGDECQHVLEPVAIRRPRRLPSIHELAHDPCPEFVGLPRVRLTLRGDREAFFRATTFGLLAGGDTEVGHREQHRGVRLDGGVGGDCVAHGGLLRLGRVVNELKSYLVTAVENVHHRDAVRSGRLRGLTVPANFRNRQGDPMTQVRRRQEVPARRGLARHWPRRGAAPPRFQAPTRRAF